MSRHVPPHRWAALASGQLQADARDAAEAHASECVRCASQRERVLQGLLGMADMRDEEAPNLRWDHIGARIHWVTSSEQRARSRQGRLLKRSGRLRIAVGLGATVAAAAAVAVVVGGGGSAGEQPARAVMGPSVTAVAPLESDAIVEPLNTVAPASLEGVVTFAQGAVHVDGEPLRPDALVRQGAVISTGDGRLAVQFGAGSAFEVGPNTKLRLEQFNERQVELAVAGLVAVSLEPQPEGRDPFVVRAGDRRVVVHGTIFRVDNSGAALEVSCTRGHVVVVDGDRAVDLVSGEQLRFPDAAIARSVRATRIPPQQLAELERSMGISMIPVWKGAAAALADSSTLDVEAPVARSVKIDGVEVAVGSFMLRVLPGRHQVDDEWVDVRERVRVPVVAQAPKRRPRNSARRKQLRSMLAGEQARIDKCVARLAKQGAAVGTFVQLEIGVNRDGSQGYLNILKDNAPSVARCVRGVVDQLEFPTGPSETILYRVAW